MNQLLSQILRESELKIQTFQEQMSRFEQDPMILVNELYVNQDVLLPFLIQRYGDEALLEIQTYWYQFFLPKFKHFIGVEEVSYYYDQTVYPAPLQVYFGEEVIAQIDLFNHQFDRFEQEAILQQKARIDEIEKMLKQIQDELERKEPALQNPLVLGGANVIKLFDISIRQKKYKQEVRDEVHMLQEDFFELEKERLRIQSSIEHMKRINIEREYILDRIDQRISKLPGYISSIENSNSTDDIENTKTLERGFSLDE